MASTESDFLQAAREWICDGYSLDIRYVERLDLGDAQLWEAWVDLMPLPPAKDMSFNITTSVLAAGQRQLTAVSASEAYIHIENAVGGLLTVDARLLPFKGTQSLSYYSEPMHRERWYGPLNLHVNGNRDRPPGAANLNVVDTELRRASPPFDGMADLCGWLGLNDSQLARSGPSITIQILPPADLIFEKCGLLDDRLSIELLALESFDTSRIGLAVRYFPGDSLSSRQQIASKIRWSRLRRGLRRGRATLRGKNMDSALVMLTFGGATVRRQWFLDPTKARNHRLTAVQLFDKDLRMLRQAILQAADAHRFELGVEALLFLLGFSPTVMIERDAPDLIVATPVGRLVLVECTTRIADFHSKLGKLIDRRGALNKVLQSGGHASNVLSALVCALPRDQIAVSDAELAKHAVLLLTAENLAAILNQARLPADPDKLLDDAFYVPAAR